MAKREDEFFAKRGMLGFGVGRRNDRPIVRFFVIRKLSLAKLPRKDRLPKAILVKGRKVATEVTAIGARPTFAATALGDPTANRMNFRSNGTGTWPMGTEIRLFDPGTNGAPRGGGTSGCLVREPNGGSPWMMTCAHVLQAVGLDVTQHAQNRDPVNPGGGPPPKLRNFVGSVVRVSDNMAKADAGLVECAGASPLILNIGMPKPPEMNCIYDGIWVQKSGCSTGVTTAKVEAAGVTLDINYRSATPGAPPTPVRIRGLFTIRNHCRQKPPAPAVPLPAGAARKFAFAGDSGALVVLGKTDAPGTFGTKGEGLQKAFDHADQATQTQIIARYHKAALGLLIASNTKIAIAQELAVAFRVLGPLELVTS